jgi:DNA sulfur modification protein DndC
MTTAVARPEELSLDARITAILDDLRDEYRQEHNAPWIVGFSGGKDSTLLAQLVFEMLLALPPRARKRQIHLVANDTLVESPIIARHLDAMLERIESAIVPLRLPVTVARTVPEVEQTFWVNLIGRGYPSPSRMFRWCTDRMKIAPTARYVREQVDAAGRVIMLLGVRAAESGQRAVSVFRYRNGGERLNPHNSLPGCMVYRPIVDLDTDEVWQFLLQAPPPWGGSHRELITLYRNAAAGECPMVTDREEAPSCGTKSSRFGCWTCTVVEKDRSAEAFVGAGYDNLEPLLEMRDWLKAIRDDNTKRSPTRRNGKHNFVGDGRLIPGPFTLAARKEILDRLLEVQDEVGFELISAGELNAIQRHWAADAILQEPDK